MSRAKKPARVPGIDHDFAHRLNTAFLHYQARHAIRLTNTELAALIGKHVASAPVGSTVGRWFEGRKPEIEVLGVLAQVLEVEAGWLAFGGPKPGAPRAFYQQLDERLNAAELALRELTARMNALDPQKIQKVSGARTPSHLRS